MAEQIRVGVAGMGIMGAPMAINLRKAGFPVTVYNRTVAKCAPVVEQGASMAKSLGELAMNSDVVITIVSDTPDVEAVLFGPEGLAESLKPGSTVIDMSTISPRSTADFAKRLAAKSVDMLDAPVSGGESGAKAGTLSIMVGGEQKVLDRCMPVLQAMGKNIVYTGPSGNGQKTKLVNQVVGSLNLLATVEGMRLASAAGLDLEKTVAAVGGGAASSWSLLNLGPKIANQDFSPGFFIKLNNKDLRLAAELFDDVGIDPPGTGLMRQLFAQALDKGLGDLGTQGLYKVWS